MQIEMVPVGDLLRDPANVRKHDTKNLESIKGSLKAFGQQKPIVVDKNGIVIAGNGTLAAAVQLGWETIAVVRSDLEGTNRTAYAIADNRTAELAEWDMSALADQLMALDELDFELDKIGFDKDELAKLLGENDNTGDNSQYTNKIEIPIYEPTGKKPAFSEMYDITKHNELMDQISKSAITDDEMVFLEYAAKRHIVFNYQQIAEYYAHASPEMQNLMEKSALVIIDFNKAIENGFTELSRDIADAYLAD